MSSRVIMEPRVWANVLTGDGSRQPQWLDHILQASTELTIAPAVSQGTIIVSDPLGVWANTIRPNDVVSVYFNSRRKQRLVDHGPIPSWKGLVDDAVKIWDPRAQWGRACLIRMSSFWKLLVQTRVPLYRFGLGDLPARGITTDALIAMALSDVLASTGIRLNLVVNSALVGITPFWTPVVPTQFTDPQEQSWASYILSNAAMAGNELFFNESGDLIYQQTQFAREKIDFLLPNEECFDKRCGVSDDGLVTNVAVNFNVVPLLALAGMAPAADATSGYGWNPGTIGPLPQDLQLPNGQALPRLGQRAESVAIPWLNTHDDAQRYAQMLRAIGLARVNHAEIQAALDGDRTLASIIGVNQDQTYRYYLTGVRHTYDYGNDAMTLHTLRYGIRAGQHWDITSFRTPATSGIPQPGPIDANCGNLPPLADDPDVRITRPTISIYTVQKLLASTPMAASADYFYQQCVAQGIDPSYALAVMQIETQRGTDHSFGALNNNPGNLGPNFSYASWNVGIQQMVALLARFVNQGLTTVSKQSPVYCNNCPSWAHDVTATMLSYRLQDCLQTHAPAPGPGDRTQPHGDPFGGKHGYSETQGFGNNYYLEPKTFYQGVLYQHFHRGVDLAPGKDVNVALFATMNGMLQAGEDFTGYGFLVSITNGPWIVKYGHCNGLAPGVASGHGVLAGDWIALSGGDISRAPTFADGASYAGNSTGAHLHYEIDNPNADTPVNPWPYMR